MTSIARISPTTSVSSSLSFEPAVFAGLLVSGRGRDNIQEVDDNAAIEPLTPQPMTETINYEGVS